VDDGSVAIRKQLLRVFEFTTAKGPKSVKGLRREDVTLGSVSRYKTVNSSCAAICPGWRAIVSGSFGLLIVGSMAWISAELKHQLAALTALSALMLSARWRC